MQAGTPGGKPAMMGSGMPNRRQMRKARRKTKKAIKSGELNMADMAAKRAGVDRTKAQLKARTRSSFIEPNKELKFEGGMKGKYQTAGPKVNKKDPMTGRDVSSGAVSVTGGTSKARPSNPITGISPRQRAQNTGQGSAQKTKKGESIYKESTMDRIARATVPAGSRKGDGSSPTKKVLDKLGSRAGKSTQGPKATKIETGVKPRSESQNTATTPKSGSSGFGKAFAAARKAGKMTFKFNGKTYGTRRKGETPEQHKIAMDKASGKGPKPTVKTEAKSTPKTETKTEAKTESKTETKPTPKTETAASEVDNKSTTPPDRRAVKSKGKEERKKLRGEIKEARKQKRTKNVVKRQGKRVGKLQERLDKLKGKKRDGGMMKYGAGGLKEPSADQKGLKKLPTAVRNKMGYKKSGGKR